MPLFNELMKWHQIKHIYAISTSPQQLTSLMPFHLLNIQEIHLSTYLSIHLLIIYLSIYYLSILLPHLSSLSVYPSIHLSSIICIHMCVCMYVWKSTCVIYIGISSIILKFNILYSTDFLLSTWSTHSLAGPYCFVVFFLSHSVLQHFQVRKLLF